MIKEIANTRFGFVWNNLHVERICENEKGIYLYLCTDKNSLEIRITKDGKIIPEEVEKKEK